MAEQSAKHASVEVCEQPAEPRGWLFTLTPWKAALLGPFVDFVGLAAMIPLLPFFVADCGADEVWIGAIMSAQYAGVCVGSVFWGRIADSFGVRRTYLVLLLLDVVLFALSGFMTSVVSLLIVRTLAGFCAIMPLGSAWISATAPPDRMMQAFTYLVASLLLGFIAGSAIGGAAGQIKTGIGIGDGGWFSALASSAALCVIAFFIILLGTAPPPQNAAGSPKNEPKRMCDVIKLMIKPKFVACCSTAFLGANEGGMMLVITGALLAAPQPDGYGYGKGLMAIVWMAIATVILLSSLFFTAFLEKRSHPLQRIVLLGIACTSILLVMGFVMSSWDANGLMVHGDKVYLGLKCTLFLFQCVVGPTAMAIAASVAATAPEANATIMGVQQSFMSMGQAVGPIVGALLLKVNLSAPLFFVVAFEVVVLSLNTYVLVKAQRNGDVGSLCNLRRRAAVGEAGAESSQADVKVASYESESELKRQITPVLLGSSPSPDEGNSDKIQTI